MDLAFDAGRGKVSSWLSTRQSVMLVYQIGSLGDTVVSIPVNNPKTSQVVSSNIWALLNECFGVKWSTN